MASIFSTENQRRLGETRAMGLQIAANLAAEERAAVEDATAQTPRTPDAIQPVATVPRQQIAQVAGLQALAHTIY